MATARSVFRGLLANELHSSRGTSLSTTSAGNAGGTTLVDTGLKNLPSGNDDDFCVGFWILITELVAGGPAIGESGKVSVYTASSGTVTIESALTAQIQTGTSYELHRYDPNDLNTAINRSVELLYPYLYTSKSDESLIVDNLLLNPSLDTFSTTFTSWDNIGTPTLAAETTRKVHGTGSAKITATGATEGIEQNIFTTTNFKELVGKTLRVRGWTFGTVASAVRLRVTFDGSTYTNADYNGGDAEWENDGSQKIDAVIPADATEMTISCECIDAGVGYFDLVRAWIDRRTEYTIPSAILKGPYTLEIQRNVDEPQGVFDPVEDFSVKDATDTGARSLILNRALPSGMIMRVTGIGKLSTMSTDAATTEIDAPQTHLVVARAAQWLYENLESDSSIGGREEYSRLATKWEKRTKELLATPGMRMRQMGASLNRRYWYG